MSSYVSKHIVRIKALRPRRILRTAAGFPTRWRRFSRVSVQPFCSGESVVGSFPISGRRRRIPGAVLIRETSCRSILNACCSRTAKGKLSSKRLDTKYGKFLQPVTFCTWEHPHCRKLLRPQRAPSKKAFYLIHKKKSAGSHPPEIVRICNITN
jgi:hypothetical protein